jgi:hypothetical protein
MSTLRSLSWLLRPSFMGSASTRREKYVKEGFYSVSSGLSRGIDRIVLILLGLVCYMTTKIIIYYFLVEKAVSTS